MVRTSAQVEIYSNAKIISVNFVLQIIGAFFCLKPEAGMKQAGFVSHIQVNASCFSERYLHGI